MDLLTRDFKSLTTQQLFEIYKLRSEVFIVEQNCAYQDIDSIDLIAMHVMLFENEVMLGYARLIPPGAVYKEPAIGRVAIKKIARGKELGKLLMKECLVRSREMYPFADIVLSAQSYLIRFYSELGFVTEGPEYLEDDIPHTKMRRICV